MLYFLDAFLRNGTLQNVTLQDKIEDFMDRRQSDQKSIDGTNAEKLRNNEIIKPRKLEYLGHIM